jgi:hypothetical protein
MVERFQEDFLRMRRQVLADPGWQVGDRAVGHFVLPGRV